MENLWAGFHFIFLILATGISLFGPLVCLVLAWVTDPWEEDRGRLVAVFPLIHQFRFWVTSFSVCWYAYWLGYLLNQEAPSV